MQAISYTDNFDSMGWGFFMFPHPVSLKDVENLLGVDYINPKDIQIYQMHSCNGIIVVHNLELAMMLKFKLL